MCYAVYVVMQLVQHAAAQCSAAHQLSSPAHAHCILHVYTALYCILLCSGEPWARVIVYYSTAVGVDIADITDSRMMGPPGSPRSADATKYMSQRLNRNSTGVMNTRAHATHADVAIVTRSVCVAACSSAQCIQ